MRAGGLEPRVWIAPTSFQSGGPLGMPRLGVNVGLGVAYFANYEVTHKWSSTLALQAPWSSSVDEMAQI